MDDLIKTFGFPIPENFGSDDKREDSVTESDVNRGITRIWDLWAKEAIEQENIAIKIRQEREEAKAKNNKEFSDPDNRELRASLASIFASAAALESFSKEVCEKFFSKEIREKILSINHLKKRDLKGLSCADPPPGKIKTHGLKILNCLHKIFDIDSKFDCWRNRLWCLYLVRNEAVHPSSKMRALTRHPLGFDTTYVRTIFSTEGAVAGVDLMIDVLETCSTSVKKGDEYNNLQELVKYLQKLLPDLRKKRSVDAPNFRIK